MSNMRLMIWPLLTKDSPLVSAELELGACHAHTSKHWQSNDGLKLSPAELWRTLSATNRSV